MSRNLPKNPLKLCSRFIVGGLGPSLAALTERIPELEPASDAPEPLLAKEVLRDRGLTGHRSSINSSFVTFDKVTGDSRGSEGFNSGTWITGAARDDTAHLRYLFGSGCKRQFLTEI